MSKYKGNPQTEDGYIQIAMELFEQIYKFKLNGNELRILLYIMRMTYGFHRKKAELSYNRIANETNIPVDSVAKAIKSLNEMNMIIGDYGESQFSAKMYQINKKYGSWTAKNGSSQKWHNSTAKNGSNTVAKNGSSPYAKNGSHININIKDNIKDSDFASQNDNFSSFSDDEEVDDIDSFLAGIEEAKRRANE